MILYQKTKKIASPTCGQKSNKLILMQLTSKMICTHQTFRTYSTVKTAARIMQESQTKSTGSILKTQKLRLLQTNLRCSTKTTKC